MKKIILTLCLLLIIPTTVTSETPEIRLSVQNGKVSIDWEDDGSSSYLVDVYQDQDKVISSWVYESEFSINQSDITGSIVRFYVALPGQPFSDPVSYYNFLRMESVPYGPIGTTSIGDVNFSWSTVPYATHYYFQLSNGTNTITEYWIHDGIAHTTVSGLEPGEYKWRVIPKNQYDEQGKPSEWTYFQTVENLATENVLGIEKNVKTSILSTSLTYPEAAVYGPDGAIYVSDTQSNSIRRCADNVCEPYVGTFVAGTEGNGQRLTSQIHQPGAILFTPDGDMIFQDIGNYRTQIVNMETGELTTHSTHDGWSKNIYLLEDGSLIKTIQGEDRGKIIKIHPNGETSELLSEQSFVDPVAFQIRGDKIIVLDNHLKILFLFEGDTLAKKIELDTFANALYVDENDIYLGLHTAIYKLDWNFNMVEFSDNYANVVNIAPGKSGKLLVTDSDDGSVIEVDKVTGNKTTLIGSNHASVMGNIVDIEKWDDYFFLLDNKAATVWKYHIPTGIVEKYMGTGIHELAAIGSDRRSSTMFYPSGLTVDNEGNLYIGEQHHILKINVQTDKVELFAGADGRAVYGFKGDGGSAKDAQFNGIRGLDYDLENKLLYVADTYNNRIRKIDNKGVVTTVAGDGVTGVPSFNTSATESHLTKPHKVYVNKGEVYVADSWNNTVSKIDIGGKLRHIAGLSKIYWLSRKRNLFRRWRMCSCFRAKHTVRSICPR
jgi:sugar lactone lactonase YvrE